MKKYTLDVPMHILLENQEVLEFFNKYFPGVVDGPNYQYMSAVPISVLISSAPEFEDVLKACLQIANGEDVTIDIKDRRLIKPKINNADQLIYDIEDVDGKYYMLEKGFAGALVTRFTKEMDLSIKGKISYKNTPVPNVLLTSIEDAGGVQMLGIPLRDICLEYDTDYELLVEGYVDVDGNEMDPQTIIVHTKPKSSVNPSYEEHDTIALQAAREGIVLLKNKDNLLPIDKNSILHIVNENQFRMAAVGAGKINPRYQINLRRAIDEYSDFTRSSEAPIGLMVISRASGENFDNEAKPGEYYLTEQEEEQLKTLRESSESLIVIINSGYPMDVSWIEKYQVDAALWCGFSGMLGGRALVEILDGRICPSAKLPDTWALDYFDYPSSLNFYQPSDGEPKAKADSPYFIDTFYEEDIYVGYRYFETFCKPVAYPFGFGLSYTQFDWKIQYDEGRLLVTVTNTGDCLGKDIVQVYASIPEGVLEQPSKRLVAFAKTKLLSKGDSQVLTLTINKELLTSFDSQSANWILEAGDYIILVGTDVQQTRVVGSLTVPETVIYQESHHYMVPPIEIDVLSKKKNQFPKGENSGQKKDYTKLTPAAIRQKFTAVENQYTRLVSDYTVEELARLSVCASAGWGMHETGEAGRIYRLKNRGLPRYAVADGNNGVNVHTPNIGMPCSNTVCASWNTDLSYKVGEVIAKEAKEQDIQMILAPAMNIHRDPLNGRHPEYYSEDALLAGYMAGFHAKGLEENGISSCYKHVVANNCESSRKRNHSFISERALREIYLKVFELAMSIHKPDSIMTAYNACNGVFTAEDEELLQGIFRKEFGFEGFIMTDWNSYDTVDIVKAVAGGNAWLTPGSTDNTYTKPIVEAVQKGEINILRLKDNVGRLLAVVKKRCGGQRNV
ncbi:glycoside hydrolase family 3 C-terminal domain-containing protein [Tuanshanicoccus lijuaniae]|uniref:glycoside hydrolase family 3 N-terminal domain-containing protein n=1 Tax=Aerococcaceae bacterium zg-1292 TaxID=2774330 RepID=UPI0019382EAA|nr:glycoside hydrolase family 3 C-terminal domain-containing protein [Aerococcaceae bacterium zg-1292]QQA37022.1 glycoside hydrolase family 3 C-terminal domain-containing protein [Aerococcaceae bacterium zg-1292]